ncbi:MAG: hypothetical protein KIT63_10095 [Rhodoferax sp.]|nr:hypothetical protein [Rhodoferax sp.]
MQIRRILQLLSLNRHAPKARAKSISQFADGQLSTGKPLQHRAFALHDHLNNGKLADAKTLPGKIDSLRKPTNPERTRIARLKAELEFQASQRARGIYRPDTPPIVPPRVSRQLRATPCAAG